MTIDEDNVLVVIDKTNGALTSISATIKFPDTATADDLGSELFEDITPEDMLSLCVDTKCLETQIAIVSRKLDGPSVDLESFVWCESG